MEDTHSIFIATDELYTSPVINKYANLFDISLVLGKVSLLSFVFPFQGDESNLATTLIHYNADLIDILDASVCANDNQAATLTLSLEARDVGITSLTISTNENLLKIPAFTAYVPQLIKVSRS